MEVILLGKKTKQNFGWLIFSNFITEQWGLSLKAHPACQMVKASGPMFEITKIDAGWNLLINYLDGSEYFFTATALSNM